MLEIVADMSEQVQMPVKDSASQKALITRVVIVVAVAAVAFLMGFVPEKTRATRAESKLAEMRQEVRLLEIQANLASATIDARRGEYEQARRAASGFFTRLRAELDRGKESSLSNQQREQAATLLAPRDDIITLLARGDPACADRLADLYVRYRNSAMETGTTNTVAAADLIAR